MKLFVTLRLGLVTRSRFRITQLNQDASSWKLMEVEEVEEVEEFESNLDQWKYWK